MRTDVGIMRKIAILFVIMGLFGAGVDRAAGQSYLTSTGSPSFSAPEPVELGFIDASNGNLHLSIPLGSYPQRGTSQPQAITLEYDSSIWTPIVNGLTLQWSPANSPMFVNWNGWYFSLSAGLQSTTALPTQNCYTDWSWTDPNGAAHTFHLNESSNSGCPNTADAFATDSSGYHMYAGATYSIPTKVYAPDGTLAYSSQGTQDPQGHYIMIEDSNGNYLSANSYANPTTLYDTLGRQIAAETGTLPATGIAMTTSQGTSTWSITSATINVKTHFQQSNVTEATTTITVIRSLTLPDGSTYYFTYDCDSSSGAACGSPSGQSAYYGELIGITLPTGGTISYSYTTFTDAYSNKSEWASMRVAAGGTWYYTPQVLSTCSSTQVNCQQQTTVTLPTGAQTVYTLQLNNGAWPISIVRKDYSGTYTTVNNTWDMSQSCVLIGCHGASFIRLLTQQTTVSTPGGNLTKQVSYSYDSPQTGNRTAIKEWRYISGGSFASTPDRATYITYLSTGTNDINKPLSVTLCNSSGSDSACLGGGTRVSQTLYTYDSYGANGLSSITAVAHHDDSNFGVGYTTRGNVTSMAQWVSGSNYLTTSYNYDTTGQVLKATDPAGDPTQYFYTDSFYTDPGNDATPTAYTPQHPTNAYPTKVTDPIGSQTTSYYWGSGDVAIATDYNGVSTTNHYQDGVDRQTEEIDPIDWKLATYSSATQSDMYTAVGDALPSTVCTSCQHTQSILDSWGRTAKQILVNNPIGPVEVDNTYDTDGRLYTQSHPYSGSGDPNHVFEMYFYDGLDRQTAIEHPDNQLLWGAYGSNVGSLGGATSQQGSTTTYGYGYPQVSNDEAGNKRQQWLDGFGRIVEVDEPNSSALPGAIVTVSGSERSYHPLQGITIWDSGSVTLTVNSRGYTAYYGQGSSASGLASSIASAISNDSGAQVTAALSGSSITLTGKTAGSYSFSFSESTNYPQYFGSASFSGTPASGSLSSSFNSLTSSPIVTNYIYDAGDRLIQVVQGSQTRTFAYDGLGRKISETTPEGGTVTYTYTAAGGGLCSGDPSDVCQRTDARGVVSTYTYYANRLTGVSYNIPGGENIAAMPNVCTTTPNGTSANVCYYYDQGGASAYAIGRLTSLTDPTGSETTSYNKDGTVKQVSKVTSGNTYNTAYQYYPGGEVIQVTYPSGRVVNQAYNVIGQLCLISPNSSGCGGSGYYASIPVNANVLLNGYDAPGHLQQFTYGNGVAASFGYSAPRMQLSSLKYTFGSSTYFNLGYWYQQNSPNCPNGTTQNNGSIQCITDSVDSGRTANYSYDLLGRVISAKTNGSTNFPQWGLAETYDRFGNRPSQSVTAGSGPSVSLAFNSNNQPISPYQFDASGNMTVEPLTPPNNMTYDGENRMTAFSGNGGSGSYTYDGNGLRVVKSANGITTVSVFSGSSVIAEYDNGAVPSSPSREYIYNPAGGATTGMLAMISGGTTTYYHQDHLSARLTTNASGGILTQEGHFPFGELWYQSGPGNKWIFTSYQRDSESGLDYALARYYDSRTGTFCSADPLAGSPEDPQSWNRYPYGRNDPIDITDPSGQHWWNWLLDAGGIAAMIFAPQIDAFLGNELGGLFGASAADVAEPVLHVRDATQLISTVAEGAGDAAGAGGGSFSFSAGLAGVAAAQATDRPKTKKQRHPAGAASHTNCPPGTTADTSGDPDYTGGASEYGVNQNGSLTRFAGRRTASGKIFNPWGYTAATRAGANGEFAIFPKFSYVNVVSAANPTKNVVVQITDTGALGTDDLLDLSAGAMKQLTGKAFNRVPVNIYPCHPGGK